MNITETLLNFNHYGLVSFVLFVFVFLGTGAVKGMKKQIKKEITTRKSYPKLIEIYNQYFVINRGFNPLGAILANEAWYIHRSPYVWNYKISWRLMVLDICILFGGIFLALIIISSFLLCKNKATFVSVGIFIVLFCLTMLIKIGIKKSLHTEIRNFTNKVDNFLQSNSLTRDEVYIPPIKDNKIIKYSFWFTVWNALILVAMFFVFYKN